jgi:hypothetical protein
MPGFKTHVTVSSMLGAGYAGVGAAMCGVPLPTAILAGGLCAVAGMFPDIDSDSGVPHRESLAFAAAVVPVMLADRLQHLHWPVESIILTGAGVYLFIRFVVSHLIQRLTVHRGMFHSIPAVLVFGELAFLLFSGDKLGMRCFIAAAVVLGSLSHLVLDEIWSVSFAGGVPRLKSSFGTALKLYTHKGWVSNVAVYSQLVVLSCLTFYEPQFMQGVYHQDAQGQSQEVAKDLQKLGESGEQLLRSGYNAARDALRR